MTAWAGELLAPVSLSLLLVALLMTAVVLWRVGAARWHEPLRRRFVAGVPWGTLLVVLFVVCVYLVVQDAWGSLSDPLVVPFRSWSISNPVGMLTSAFAHQNFGHLTGNLLSTAVYAPIVEYAWGHYPREEEVSIGRLDLDTPARRIGAFVVAVGLVGLATSLLVPGPAIGFSGVVFAFAGFAIVVAPLRAISAIVGVRVVNAVYYAVVDPVPLAVARTQYVQPWFANVAIQGHLVGLLVGVLLGIAFVRQGSRTPSLRRVWFATLVFAVMQGMWAFFWYVGASSYRLFRAAGLAAVLVLAALVVLAVAATRGPPRWTEDMTGSHFAGAALLAILVAIGFWAVLYGFADVSVPTDTEGVEVEGYTVYYAENVSHGYADALELPLGADALLSTARAGGVIVAHDRRNIWEEVVPAGRLALDGRATVSVGGLGWRERVVANRTGWDAIDGNETYKVFLRPPDGPRKQVFTGPPTRLAPRIAGYNLTVEPAESGYRLTVTRNGSRVAVSRLPRGNETVEVADLAVQRRNDSLFASHDGTRVRVARYERAGD